ncbi:hypothetical protein COU53_02850 [Candidatus Pacearchaeota archaeon CG10_big_fil_rev_8_21_14_0_10_30_48]|nr:MAG: hypothetical protein COU53_02850 [Candidatus Pacearchaeota archaeon CG10_big_fil_rev_8_21_14_0_10_30_48]
MVTGFIIEKLGVLPISELSIIFQIGLMIVFAGIFAFIFKLLKQPRILAYIVAGIILGPLVLGIIESNETILALSEIGVAFLLFFAGLEIHLDSLKKVGKSSIFIGLFEVTIMVIISLAIFSAFSKTNIELLYIALVVALSSTMIVIKSLSDRDQLRTLHGRMIVSILLIQDIIAITALAMLTDTVNLNAALISLGKASLFIVFAIILAKVAKPIFRISAKSNELILIITLSFLFLFSLSAYSFGLSIAIGSFFAGVALANSTYKTEIKGRVHSLRDFFGAILFVSLGVQLTIISSNQINFLIILIALIMIIKPLLIVMLTRIGGYTDRTAFLTGNYMGQSSEFSLILITQGLILGQITNEFFSVLVFATIISMSLTGYVISFEKGLYHKYSKFSRLLKKVPANNEMLVYGLNKKRKKIILFGCHRMGSMFLKKYKGDKNELLVIDFNPEIIKYLMKKKIPCLYGDYGNPEVFETLKFLNPEIVLSTIPSKEENINIIKMVKTNNQNNIVVVVAESIHDAIELYHKGADYVVVPKVVSGEGIFDIISALKKDKDAVKKKEINQLKKAHHYLFNPDKK